MIIDKYQEYLKSQKWNDIKKLVFKRDKYICQGCLTETKNLQAHHLTYDRIYNEMCFDLITLCRKCHCNIHDMDSVDDYLEKRKPNKDETIYRLNGSVVVGYKDEYSKEIKNFMKIMESNKIKNYYVFQYTNLFDISTKAYRKVVDLLGVSWNGINFEEIQL